MIVNCAVCDRELNSMQAASCLESEEMPVFFCGEYCRQLFEEAPQDYLTIREDDRGTEALFVELC